MIWAIRKFLLGNNFAIWHICCLFKDEPSSGSKAMRQILKLITALFVFGSMTANAVPITYGFSTGSTPFGDATLVPFFSGFSVTGTFVYDSDTPATTIIPSGPVAGSTLYLNSTANLVGSVGAWSFSDPIGRTIVGNNTFQGSLDFLNLIADPNLDSGAPPSAFGLDGFDVDGFSLINVRMFWIQGQLGITDFLSNQDLPNPLPDFQGRLAFDFTPTTNPGVVSSVFFDGWMVARLTMISEVGIDIKPGSDPNGVNLRSNGVIPVAVFGSVDFDATQVDFSTVVFGPDEASPVHDGHVEDVNGDFFDDMVFHFKVSETGIECSDTGATLTGETFGGESITGTDAVKTVGCK